MSNQTLAETYEKDGYVVVERAFSAPQLRSLKNSAASIVEKFDVSKHHSVFSTKHRDRDRDRYFIESAQAVHCFLEEDALTKTGELNRPKEQAINKIGHAMHDLVPEFAEFCRLPVISESLRDIGLVSPQLWQTMYIFKQPKIGGEVRWHQDASYLIAGGRGVTGIWISMEDADRSNGCLWMQPGGHRSPLREIYEVTPEVETGVLRTLDEAPWPGEAEAVALEVPAGSMVVFSGLMPHYSSQNRSERSRQAFTLHLVEEGANWSERNWLQRGSLEPFAIN